MKLENNYLKVNEEIDKDAMALFEMNQEMEKRLDQIYEDFMNMIKGKPYLCDVSVRVEREDAAIFYKNRDIQYVSSMISVFFRENTEKKCFEIHYSNGSNLSTLYERCTVTAKGVIVLHLEKLHREMVRKHKYTCSALSAIFSELYEETKEKPFVFDEIMSLDVSEDGFCEKVGELTKKYRMKP